MLLTTTPGMARTDGLTRADFNVKDKAWAKEKKFFFVGDDTVGADIAWRSRLKSEANPQYKQRAEGLYQSLYVQQTADMTPPFGVSGV